MKKFIKVGMVVVCLLLFGTSGFAATTNWSIDPAHSGFYFSVNHIYSKVNGFFEKYEGTIQFDPDNLKESRLSFKVKVKSINTQNGKRDGHLQSDEFFDTKRFPEMTFKSMSISHVQGNNYLAKGILTIKAVSKEMEVPFTYFGFKANPFNPKQDVAGFETRMTIDRLEYNVGNGKFYKMGVVGNKVDILISIEATHDK